MYSLWDRWEIRGDPSCTLRQFMKLIEVGINFSTTLTNTQLQEKYKLQPSMVVYGVKMVYVPLLPGHKKRLGQTLVDG